MFLLSKHVSQLNQSLCNDIYNNKDAQKAWGMVVSGQHVNRIHYMHRRKTLLEINEKKELNILKNSFLQSVKPSIVIKKSFFSRLSFLKQNLSTAFVFIRNYKSIFLNDVKMEENNFQIESPLTKLQVGELVFWVVLFNLKNIKNVTETENKKIKILSSVSSGSFGDVYLAYSIEKLKYFALKCPRIKQKSKKVSNLLKSFRNEKEILRTLNHENIIKLFPQYFQSPSACICLEFAAGGDLNDFVERKEFNEDDIKFIMNQVLRGVNYLHSIRILHRDIKLKNILLMTSGKKPLTKLTDFGTACSLDDANQLMKFCGTTAYAAREIHMIDLFQPKITIIYNEKVDIWSIGVCIYKALSRQFPFGNIHDKYSYQIAAFFGRRKTLCSLPMPKFTKLQSHLINCCLNKDPEERKSAKELLNHPWFD